MLYCFDLGQYYVPKQTMYNKDFLKAILGGGKNLFKLKDVKFINVPLYDELSVKRFWPMMQEDEEFMKYLPDKLPVGRIPDRDYFWNIFNTLNEEYVTKLISHANKVRSEATSQQQASQVIEITEAMWDELHAEPFVSCKFSRSSNFFQSVAAK